MTTTESPTGAPEDLLGQAVAEPSVNEELARLVLAQGELRLQAQLQIALAADQRAMVLAGICAAAAAAFLGAGVVFFDAEAPQTVLGAGAIAIAIVFGIAGGLATVPARPAAFWLAGAQPRNWWEGGALSKPLADAMVAESWNYEDRIVKNERFLSRNARLLLLALRLACVAPLLGAICGAAVSRFF